MGRRIDSKIREKEIRFLIFYLLSAISLLIYMYGFFPLKFTPKITQERNDKNKENALPRIIDKLAFIVIDALRYDFVSPDEGKSYMPFLFSTILNNRSCLVTTKAHSPTVTLPRLKAITSGFISTYMDVLLNFMSSNLEEDNFIHLANSKGLKIVFYGDDTWLKLFPKSFLRSEGTHSFYAMDFVEVDNNVTRHIDDEFKKTDWDIIILHYLGLDHIGHFEGPRSHLVKPKLVEMDSVVEKFYNHFEKLEKNEGLKTMLIVTGDHGMKDTGSHGGVSFAEVTIPLVSVAKPCVELPGWPEDHTPFQIDIAPTLTSFFGLPFPAHNMGKIIPSLFHGISRKEIFKRLEMNRMEFEKFEMLLSNDFEVKLAKNMLEKSLWNDVNNQEIEKHIGETYFEYLNQVSHKLIQSSTNFQMPHLISGVLLLWIVSIIMIFHASKYFPKPSTFVHNFFILGTFMHSISLLSTSFIEEEHQTWYFFWASLIVLIFLEPTQGKSLSHQKIKDVIPWIGLAVAHRILRKLNQTGDKWASLPDIKFYLNSDKGQTLLFLLFVIGIILVFICVFLEEHSKLQLLTYGISLLSVICYRIATKNFQTPFLAFYPFSRGIFEALVFWISISIFAAQTVYYKTSSHLVWLLLASLLLRPHNVILLPLEVYTSKKIHQVFSKPENLVWNNFAHIWMGNVFYFYQGNGNSISNLDVASAFVGIQTYNPIVAGVLMTAHTFNGQILSFLLSPKLILVCAFVRLIPLSIYCTALLFQLHHLFIWSVFSPKLLYEICSTALYALLISSTQAFNFCVTNFH